MKVNFRLVKSYLTSQQIMLEIQLNKSNKTSSELITHIVAEEKTVNKALTNLPATIQKLASNEANALEFKGGEGSSISIQNNSAKSREIILLAGAGKSDAEDRMLKLGSSISKQIRGAKVGTALINIPDALTVEELQLMCFSLLLFDYRFDKYKGDKKKAKSCKILINTKLKGATEVLKKAKVIAESVAIARDLVNEPGNAIYPESLANYATKMAKKHGFNIKVMGPAEIKKEKMTCFLSVSAGSTTHPARFMHMSLKNKPGTKKKKIFIIGKGVTFDSGGLSMKPSSGMETMKLDMAGSATVIGTMVALANLGSKYEVHAIVAATENMPWSGATKPGDVVMTRSGKTVEVLNTDAEGRLTLCDAITYAKDKGAEQIIDLATLTGACLAALGPNTAGYFCNDEKMSNELMDASGRACEELWRLPLNTRLKKKIKSDVADLKNIGHCPGGAITAALFLEAFVGDTSWAHFDIAGPAFIGEEYTHQKKGGTGYGITTLLEYLKL